MDGRAGVGGCVLAVLAVVDGGGERREGPDLFVAERERERVEFSGSALPTGSTLVPHEKATTQGCAIGQFCCCVPD